MKEGEKWYGYKPSCQIGTNIDDIGIIRLYLNLICLRGLGLMRGWCYPTQHEDCDKGPFMEELIDTSVRPVRDPGYHVEIFYASRSGAAAVHPWCGLFTAWGFRAPLSSEIEHRIDRSRAAALDLPRHCILMIWTHACLKTRSGR